jgi:hypothetical protein
MKNKKYTFIVSTHNETDHIVTEPPYDFEDWLRDNIDAREIKDIEIENNSYYLIGLDGERLDEVYTVIREEYTDEDLVG